MADNQEPATGNERTHHRRVMLIAIVTIALLLTGMIWVARLIVEQQKLERCLATGQRDCLRIETPQSEPLAAGGQSEKKHAD